MALISLPADSDLLQVSIDEIEEILVGTDWYVE